MIPKSQQAAELLTGKTLSDGWVVGNKITDPAKDKGGVYSCCYEVSKDNRKGFLKAFDYSGAERIGESSLEYMRDLINSFSNERDILDKCTKAKCKNVVHLIAHGSTSVENLLQYPRVEYLIMEYAENGDINDALSENDRKMEWKLRSLHQLFKGVDQIHKLSIAHQDLKPTNIVVLSGTKNENERNGDITKLSDFGSAINIHSKKEDLPRHLREDIIGTWSYAPPELLYGEAYEDSILRRIGCDLYLLGSMVVYYFTKRNMTSLLNENLAPHLSWTKQSNYGAYKQIKPFLELAFTEALIQIEKEIEGDFVKEKIILIVKYLCNPDPEKRGHPRDILGRGSNYNLHRFITILDKLASYYFIKGK